MPRSEDAGATSAAEGRPASRKRPLKNQVAAAMRWLHIYLSMFGLATVLFFGVTGVTLNHPDWVFGGAELTVQAQGEVARAWINPEADKPPMKLEVVEHLRSVHAIRGALAEFKLDDRECMVSFKGPGYSADAFIDRETGHYNLAETRHGFLAVINDLHKGRDTGPAWSVVIDLSAALMVIISLTGLALLFYIKRRRIPGTIIGVVGTIVLAVMYWFWVP